MSYDVKPSKDLIPELQKYVSTFADSQRRMKEYSMQRALNWLKLSSNHYPTLSDLSFTLEGNPEQFCAVLDCLGTLIDLDIIDEFMKSNQ
jgi:hypothetical protein